MNSRQQQSPMNNPNSPYTGAGSQVQIPSPNSSTTIPQPQTNPSPPNNALTTTTTHMSTANSPANMSIQSGDVDMNDSQNSVQKIIQEMIMSSQLSGLGNDVKSSNGILQTGNNPGISGGNCLMGNGIGGGGGFGNMGNNMGIGHSPMVNGMRAAMGNNSNSVSLNGRIGMAAMTREQSMNHHHHHHQQQQQDLGNQLLSGLGAVNGFNNLPFDWKPSP